MFRQLMLMCLAIIVINSCSAKIYIPKGCTPRDEMKDIYPPFGCFALVKVCAGLCGNGYSSTYYTTNPSTGQYIPNVQCSCCRETSMAERTIACNGVAVSYREPASCGCVNCG